MRLSIESTTRQSIYFDSMLDAARFMEKDFTPETDRYIGDNPGWSGGTKEDCINMLRQGNIAAMKEYSALDASLPANIIPPAAMQQDIYYDVAGASVDIGAYMQGAPECMLEFTQHENFRFVDIYIGISYSQGTAHGEIVRKFLHVVKLIDLLESTCNYRCSIHVGDFSEGAYGRTNCDVWVKVKDHREPLDLPTMLCIVSPMFLRIFKIGVMHYLKENNALAIPEGGATHSYDRDHTDAPPSLPDGALYINSMYSRFDKSFTYRANLSNFNQFARRYLSMLPDNQ